MSRILCIDLQQALVNLNGLGVYRLINYLDGYVYAISLNTTDQLYIKAHLDDGMVYEVEGFEHDMMDDYRRGTFPEEHVMHKFVTKYTNYDPKDLIMCNDTLVARVVISLLTHRVSGDEIIQGLKLKDITERYKLTERYIGGWIVTLKKGRIEVKNIPDVSVETWIDDFLFQIVSNVGEKG